MQIELKNKKLIPETLLPFGFAQRGEVYTYLSDIADGQFRLTVTVSPDGTLMTRTVDTASGEEYVLHLMDGAAGSFIGQVREEYDAVLDAVIARCYEDDIFHSEDAKRLIAHVRETYGDELEFLWKRFPDNAVWRRKDTGKWYAALLTVSRRKLGLDSDEIVEIIDLRMQPGELQHTVDHQTYFPGWHMNKKSWLTIILDGSVTFEELCQRLAESYRLAVK